MDARRHSTPADLARLHDYYKYKFQGLEFDIIIASDNAALNFLLQNHQDLFPETPVVFCGVGLFGRDYDFSQRPLFTGGLESTDIADTLALALKLHPESRRVVVITDNQPALRTGRAEPPDLERIFPQVEFVVLDPLNLELPELLSRLRNIPSNSIGLLEAFFQIKSGQMFTASQSTRLIADNSAFPLYGVNANTFLHGIVGGRLNDGYFQGVEAARRALAILKGTVPSRLPIIRESINRFQFDYLQLERWKIDSSLLRKEASF